MPVIWWCFCFGRGSMPVSTDVIGKGLNVKDGGVDNAELIAVNAEIRNHPVEVVGQKLRSYMTAMKKIV